MGYKVQIIELAALEVAKFDKTVQKRIYSFLQKLELVDNPRDLLIPYTANLAGFWKKRIGDYRIICRIDDKKIIVEVIKVGHRSKIYKK